MKFAINYFLFISKLELIKLRRLFINDNYNFISIYNNFCLLYGNKISIGLCNKKFNINFIFNIKFLFQSLNSVTQPIMNY